MKRRLGLRRVQKETKREPASSKKQFWQETTALEGNIWLRTKMSISKVSPGKIHSKRKEVEKHRRARRARQALRCFHPGEKAARGVLDPFSQTWPMGSHLLLTFTDEFSLIREEKFRIRAWRVSTNHTCRHHLELLTTSDLVAGRIRNSHHRPILSTINDREAGEAGVIIPSL